MPAPNIAFVQSGVKLSAQSGFQQITVGFSSDIAYQAFECRATKTGEPYGVGKGTLLASFGFTPAGTERTFEIYSSHLLKGDGEYRISLFAQSEDGGWNDNHIFIPNGTEGLWTAEGEVFYCERE